MLIKIIPEYHFVGTPYGQTELLSWPMRIVPHATGARDHESSHSSYESTAPKGEKHKYVESYKVCVTIVSNVREVVRRRGGE
jgi:hypothetical protein